MAVAGLFINAGRSGMIDIINRAEDEFLSLPPLLQEFFRWLEHSGVEPHPGPKVNAQDSDVGLRSEKRGRLFSMFGVTTSDDYRPVAWMGRFPVDVTTMLVGLHVAMAVLGAVLVAIGAGSVLGWLQFDSAEIWYGAQVWRIFTYAFVHAPSALL